MTCPIRKASFFVFGTGKFTPRTGGGGGGGGGAGGCAVLGAQWGPVDSPPAVQWEVRSGFFSGVSRSYLKK